MKANKLQKALSWILSLILPLSNSLPGYAQIAADSANSEFTYEQALKELEPIRSLLQSLRAEIDRSQFDIDEVIEDLDYDRAMIIQFVSNEIYFEQYRGALRGALGTLMSRAGNALDQSLLLATLLKSAGYDARIVEGTLSDAQARILLDRVTQPREPRRPASDIAKFKALIREYGLSQGMNPDELTSLLQKMEPRKPIEELSEFRKAEQDAAYLLSKLESSGFKMGRENATELLNEAVNYFWVEYRGGPSDPWTATHPAFADADIALGSLRVEKVHAGKIPGNLQHKFRLAVVVEQTTELKVTKTSITAVPEQPTANLIGIPFTFFAYPSGMANADTPEKIEQALRQSRMFFPVINGSPAGNVAFTSSGTVVPLDAAASSYAGVFETVSSRASTAAASLMVMDNAEGKSQDEFLPHLSEFSLEYTLVAPGGGETTIRRSAFKGGTNTEPGELTQKLSTEHNFMLAVGVYPEAYILDRYLERMISSLPFMALAKVKAQNPTQEVSVPRNHVTGTQTSWLGHLVMFNSFDAANGNIPNYRHVPSLVAYTKRPIIEGGYEHSYDIINNQRRVLREEGDLLVQSPKQLVFLGAWETAMENANRGRTETNGISLFDRLRNEGADIRVFGKGDSLEPIDAIDDVKELIKSDLDSGFVVVVPTTLRSNETSTAWWRIDTESGTTLGISLDGRGAGETLKDALLRNVLIPVVVFGACMVTFGVIMGAKDIGGIWNWGAATASCAGLALIVAPTAQWLDVAGGFLGAIGTLMTMIGIADS